MSSRGATENRPEGSRDRASIGHDDPRGDRPGASASVAALLAVLLSSAVLAEEASAPPQYTRPLPTGLLVDPVGGLADVGSLPLGMAVSPAGDALAVVLSGWREQGLQVVDLKSHRVTQTLKQDAAFYGLAFSKDGRELFVSGGNDDSIFCYAWHDGQATLERKIQLGDGKKRPDGTGSRYPAGLAIGGQGKVLYVAENVADSLAVVDLETSTVVQRVSTEHYPYSVAVAGGKVYVSAWGADSVSIFPERPDGSLGDGRRLGVGHHPSAITADASGSRVYVALGPASQVAIIDGHAEKVAGYLNDRPPAGPSEGSTPNALALSLDEARLFVAEADNNCVAVFDVSERVPDPKHPEGLPPLGRIPTDWYPTGVLETGPELLVLSGKGHGSHANPDGPTPGEPIRRPLGYDLGQLNGTVRILPAHTEPAALAEYTRRVVAANGWDKARETPRYPPFHHVVYIIKENRTYDQVLGDVPGGDGDPKLVFFGETVTPNHRSLASHYGLFDRFFVNGEVSSQGHVWSTAGYVTDYGEKTIPSGYSDRRADVDGEEANEPVAGFLWTLARKAKVTFRDYGEMVKTEEGWPITQRELAPDVSPNYPPFNLKITDQVRADAWIAELSRYEQQGQLPGLEILHLGGDHTAGGRVGYRTPRAYVADNDLALGRIVSALSRSKFWKDTVVFVLEDDAQAGPDHVDSHRSVFYAISAYNRPGTVHRFVNTTDVVGAIEQILELGNLSKYDYFSRSLADVFAATPDLTPYAEIRPRADMDEMNSAAGKAAAASQGFDLSEPDRIDVAAFNEVLWSMLKPGEPPPVPTTMGSLQLLQANP